ncbi:hypothetical protein SMD44_08931 [Streptomyces alboflavus]|uniref:Uncharacterized protein n=1 Tax=Streptomyces alboflavus TaxID=67267 RepID=A0A1Z1WST2_9ACTN|nr:hypothetical protein SMD44_08931 [Streptomyces alboflavus]
MPQTAQVGVCGEVIAHGALPLADLEAGGALRLGRDCGGLAPLVMPDAALDGALPQSGLVPARVALRGPDAGQPRGVSGHAVTAVGVLESGEAGLVERPGHPYGDHAAVVEDVLDLDHVRHDRDRSQGRHVHVIVYGLGWPHLFVPRRLGVEVLHGLGAAEGLGGRRETEAAAESAEFTGIAADLVLLVDDHGRHLQRRVGIDGADGRTADVPGAPDHRGNHAPEGNERVLYCQGALPHFLTYRQLWVRCRAHRPPPVRPGASRRAGGGSEGAHGGALTVQP